jgi:integrase
MASQKAVPLTQVAIDELPLNSGTYRISDIPGLYLRCRAKTKSFFLQRRVDGCLVKESLGPLSARAAKAKAMTSWIEMKPAPPSADEPVTLGEAIEQYLAAKALAPRTVALARYNTRRYLAHWSNRTLDEIGRDRAGVRLLQQHLTKKHKRATSNQVVRLLSAVYRWHRKVDTDLPESPMVVAEIHRIRARDWAYSPAELKAWWSATKKNDDGEVVKSKDGNPVKLGVSTLGAIKKMWWLAALLTGARKGSIEALKWADVDLEKKAIRFRVTKGDRPYSIPMADKLAELLNAYKASDVPPSEWVFPSPVIEGDHLIDVKNPVEGVGPAHRLRHTFRTTLAELGASPDQARLLLGHSMGGDVSRGYISSSLLMESLRPVANAVAQRYLNILGPEVK